MAQLLQEIAGKGFQKNEAVSVSRELPAAGNYHKSGP
jgi:hypothetical protein